MCIYRCILACIWSHSTSFKLGLVDMQCGAHIHVDANTVDYCVVMVQQHSNEMRIVAMLGRDLAKREQNCTLLKNLLLCAW